MFVQAAGIKINFINVLYKLPPKRANNPLSYTHAFSNVLFIPRTKINRRQAQHLFSKTKNSTQLQAAPHPVPEMRFISISPRAAKHTL